MDFFVQTVNILADLLKAVIFVRVILSWFVQDHSHGLVRMVYEITEPILSPIRRMLPRTGLFDFSALVALLLIELLQTFFNQAVL